MVVVFCLLGLVAVVSGALVFIVNSMARATYALAVSFIAVGLALLLVRMEYLAVITILMMIMEMAIMAIYMVMFMGMNPALMPMSMVHGQRPALILSAAAFVMLTVSIVLAPWPTHRVPSPASVRELGMSIMGPKMLVMLTISPIMFATIVAGVSLASGRTRYDRFGDDLDRARADDPQSGGVGR